MINNNIIDWQIMSCGLKLEINNGIILYGASGSGKRIMMLMSELGLSDKVIAVVDSDEKKWGKKWIGYEISNPEIINNISINAIIVITSVYLDEILELLQTKLYCKQRICTVFSFRHAMHYDIMNNKTSSIKKELSEKYREKYNLWKNSMVSEASVILQQYFIDTIKCIMLNPISILLCGIPKTGNTSLRISFNVDLGNKELKDIVFTNHMLYYNKYSYNNIKNILKAFNNRKIKIIAGVREPIERIISHKWQIVEYPYYYNDVCISTFLDKEYGRYNSNLEIKGGYNSEIYLDVADWFKNYIEKVFEIDVFKYPFDKEKGYLIINKNNISIFIYRLDKLSKLEREISEFSGHSSFILKKANIASEKKYKFAYQQYLKQVRIEKDFFDSLVESKGMVHFYTTEECKKYKEKWRNKLVGD